MSFHQASIPNSLTWEPKLNHHSRGWYPGRSEPDISAMVALLCIGGWLTASLASSHWLSVVTTENTDRLLSLREVNPYSPCQPLLCSVQKNFLSTSKTCISTLNVATSKIEFIVLENLKLTGKVSALCCWARMVWRLWGKGGGEGREGVWECGGRVQREPSTLLFCLFCYEKEPEGPVAVQHSGISVHVLPARLTAFLLGFQQASLPVLFRKISFRMLNWSAKQGGVSFGISELARRQKGGSQ